MRGIGAALSAHKLLILAVLVGILLVVLLVVLVIYLRRKRAPAAAAATPPPPPRPPPVNTDLLRNAWLRFVKGLPGEYQRSLLNFEHFVVMGAPAAGKSRLIDAYSDWKRQTKEFATSQANDPNLPVYLASSEVVMEIPARILEDHSEAVYRTLNRLWRPIYRERAPTVVAVVDAVRLMESPPNQVQDLAEKMRGKINVLSNIRGRAIEVRVALTHLDEIEGYKELADFCREHEIPLRALVPPAQPGAAPERPDVGRHLEAWLDELRGHLPKALISLPSAEFRRVVSFMRRAPGISGALRPFLKALFQHEAVVADPVYGGVYLASESPGVSNPLQGALESGPGPDPQRRHAYAAAAIAFVCIGQVALAFSAQYSRWAAASDALDLYSPKDSPDIEPFRRAAVTAFTSKTPGWLERHPEFFGAARREMRKRFSDRVRKYFLQERMEDMVKKGGAVNAEGTRMAARRAAYYLGLIHSDKNDRLHILDPGQPEIWASMIELRKDTSFLSDYLSNVDVASTESTKLPDRFEADEQDKSREWIELLDQLERAVADGVVSQSELRELQKLTKVLGPRLVRFEHDPVMRRVLGELDTAAGTAKYLDGERQRPGPLEQRYQPKFDGFLKQVAWADDPNLLRALRRVVDTVNATAIDVAMPRTLGELVFRLEQLYNADSADDEDGQIARIRIEGKKWQLPSGKWAQILRDSKAEQYIDSFVAGSTDQEILFGPEALASLPPVRWNPNGDGSAVFVGRGVLDGRYTKLAYDKYVNEMVTRLSAVLARANVSSDVRARLTVAVNEQIARYAARYREEGLRFAQSFDVQAGSQEALRVALSQMINDTSAFNDFLVALDRNTRLATPTPMLAPVRGEMATFDSWHLAVDGGGAAPELGKYKAILGQLLLDLGPPAGGGDAPPPAASAAPSGGAAGADAPPETLEKGLSPAGRLYLAELRGEKGSYATLVENWLTSIRMPESQRKPFRAPLRRLAELGRAELERTIFRVWQNEMLPSLQHVAVRFPFNRAAKEEVSPQELHDLFHPKDGKFFDLFRRYVEPLAELSGRSGFHPRPGVSRGLNLPAGLFSAVNGAAALSARLWDSTGSPQPLELKISTVRFERNARPKVEGDPDRKNALTLIYLNAGEASVFNFNQQPSLVTIGFDWTKEHRSQIGLQLTDTATKENTFPPPIVSTGLYWSFYHLLLRAHVSAVKFPPTAQLYTWDIWYQADSAPGELIPARFVVVNDPWEPFAIIAQFAPRPKDPPKEARKDPASKESPKGLGGPPAPLKRTEAL
ncbi:MAG: type VI secretion protein IcmF/TssM N-terminal domain-containing protein [Minicystis sp.]